MKKVFIALFVVFAVSLNAQILKIYDGTLTNNTAATAYLEIPANTDSVYFGVYAEDSVSVDSIRIYKGTLTPSAVFASATSDVIDVNLAVVNSASGYAAADGVVKGTELTGTRTLKVTIKGASSGNAPTLNNVKVWAFIYKH